MTTIRLGAFVVLLVGGLSCTAQVDVDREEQAVRAVWDQTDRGFRQ